MIHIDPLFLSTLLLGSALCIFSSVDDLSRGVSPTQFGAFNFSELEQTLYDVELLKVPLPESALESTESQDQFIGNQYTVLVSKYGQRYACELPWKPPSDDHDQQEEQEMNATAILLPLLNRPCPVKTVGWWTYEYCHGRFVRQYHMEGGKITGKIIHLGFYENETVWDKEHIDKVQNILESTKGHVGPGPFPVMYHEVSFVNGTMCDHTGMPRTTTVMLRCSLSSDDRLYEVIEWETCNYTLIVHTALLCGHPLFDSGHRGRTQTLSCSPLLSQTEYQHYLERLETEREKPSVATDDPKLQKADGQEQRKDLPESSNSEGQHQDSAGPDQSERDKDSASHISRKVENKAADEKTAESASPKGPPKEDKDELVNEIEKNIEILYKQLLSSLDSQTDPMASKLKEAIEGKYSEFESLKEQNAMQKEIEKMLTDDEKNFRMKETVVQSKETEKEEVTKKESKASPAHSEEVTKKERAVVEPYEVQGVSTKPAGGGDRPDSEELFGEEAMAEIEEALNEQLRESGLEGLADVKVVTMPLSMMEMFMDKEEGGDSDEEQEEEPSVKMILKLDDIGRTQDKLTQLFGSFFGTSPAQQQSTMSPEQQRVRDLEDSYNQVWEEQSESDKKRTEHV